MPHNGKIALAAVEFVRHAAYRLKDLVRSARVPGLHLFFVSHPVGPTSYAGTSQPKRRSTLAAVKRLKFLEFILGARMPANVKATFVTDLDGGHTKCHT